MASSRSVVQFFPEREGYKCSYCGNEDTSLTQGMWAHTMTVQDYQDLIDRGWRRSGKYVYKPVMDKTCCPQYAIKCEALNFKLNKSHKKVLKRVNKYLNTGVKPGSSKTETDGMEDVDGGISGAVCEIPPEKMNEKLTAAIPETIDFKKISKASGSSNQAKTSDTEKIQSGTSVKQDKAVKQSAKPDEANDKSSSKKVPRLGTGVDPNKLPCKKAKDLRRERWAQKQAQKHLTQGQENNKKKQNEPKSLEDFLSEVKSDPTHKLELRLVRSSPWSKEFKDTFSDSYAVYRKYQMTVHKDPPDKPTEKQYTRFLVDSPLEIVLVRSNLKSEEFERTFKDSYKIFKKYQMGVHKEDESDCDQASFVDFLVKSPLEAEFKEGGFEHGYGSFHQQYWLDGRLVCVGVLDILPKCVSSVYLFYDPEIFFLSPGTYSALRELEFTRKIHQSEPAISYYYMGYYIHSCHKMKYKGQYVPSFLCCPETYTWHRIEECRSKLDVNEYSRFATPDVEEQNKMMDINMTLVLHERQAMPYAIYRAINPDADDEDEVRNYATLAGRSTSERMLLYRE